MAHHLFSQDQGMLIASFEKFNKDDIKKSIKAHLTEYPNDVLELCKDCPKNNINRFMGYQIIDFYQVNPKNAKPSKVYVRGNAQCFISLK